MDYNLINKSDDFKKFDKADEKFIKDIHLMDNNEIDNIPLGFFIEGVFRYYSLFLNKYLEDIDLSSKQLYILLALFYEDNVSQERLASLLNLNEVTITREINNLEKEKLVHRTVDEKDKRKKLVALSEDAFRLLETLKCRDDESENELLNYFSKDELHIFKFQLRKMLLTLGDILEE